jgi:phage baseplate assembly protein W
MTEIPDRPFGVDLRLAGSNAGAHDARISPAGDLDTVGGPEAAVQALTLRLLIRRGELSRLGWPDYGSRLHELIGEPGASRTQLRLAQYAREAVLSDPRVESVEEVLVSMSPHEARVALSLVLIGGEAARVSVVVPVGAS